MNRQQPTEWLAAKGSRVTKRRTNQTARRAENRNQFFNSYRSLDNLMETEGAYALNLQHPAKVVKPPPIIVDSNHNIRAIQKLLPSSNLRFKQMQIGTKIFVDTKNEYNNVISTLKSNNCEYYSHRAKDERQFKVFLYGLPKVSIDMIKSDLQDKNFTADDVKEVITKFTTEDNAAYAVLFQKSNVSLRDLKKVKYLCRTKVSWKQYKSKDRNNPTICWKCLMYGHGGDNCNRKMACMICASDQHIKRDCPYNKVESKVNVKCFNCVRANRPANHRANAVNCPSRAEYLVIRQNIQNKNRHIRDSSVLNIGENFTARMPQSFTRAPTPNENGRPTYAAVAGNDLYSIEELFNIFQRSLSKLRQCTSKDQQLEVVASLLQYAI